MKTSIKSKIFIDGTIQFHANFRYVDIYNRYREPLFHGEHLIGIDYSLESVFTHRYISPNCDTHVQKRFWIKFLQELKQLYDLEKICVYYNYTFMCIFHLYINEESLGCVNILYLLLKWGAHPYLSNASNLSYMFVNPNCAIFRPVN